MMRTKKKFGDLLVEAGYLNSEQIELVLEEKRSDQRLGDALLERELITEYELIKALETQLGLVHVNLYRTAVDTQLLKLIPEELSRKYMLIPIRKQNGVLQVAMADPLDYYAIDDLQMFTGFQIEPLIAIKAEIVEAIERYYQINDSLIEQEPVENTDLTMVAEQQEQVTSDKDAPIIKLVDQLLQHGLNQRASDIHIDPLETTFMVRYRIDGLLRTERTFSASILSALTARIKIMGELNITESRMPQDGRIKVLVGSQHVDMRISTLPTIFGEKIVIRLLAGLSELTKLSALGLNHVHEKMFVKMLENPSGLILLTGPTGSGKTSTLYAGMHYLNTDQVNIVTVEDPVEYHINGINQVQVNTQVGLTFAKGLRAILRQDPNIVMIGEIRDTETAEIAVRASLTGHLVLSTLHTNSAIAAIPRLTEMGIEPYLVASGLSGVVGQRLVRKICPSCRETYEPNELELELFHKRGMEISNVYRGSGCNQCNDTGFRGRIAIHEMLIIDEKIRQLLMDKQTIHEIQEYAAENGMIFLLDDGLLKVKQGITTVGEVLHVTLDH
ncbi:GspE/PulE family protein [Alkalicoccobacillus porphyridii]|uniref:Type II/IV secretion system protein n=1 Tax=Alkalicoccobacillus porphyridii TaxID=2597270 RepID=A0A553ZXS1_9BACI|nr:GspE/PulE family protein [Alkalicoccobacillus porphyridii]TSB46243.1 type II/IV secretion system protein [Alkalicoccobacillus porphyridii]